MANTVIQILIRARDEASRVVRTVSDALGRLRDQAARIPGIVGTALGAVGGLSAAGAIKSAADLEQALARVQARGDETYANTKRLREELARIAAQYRITSTQAAHGLEVLAAAGLNATDALGALPSVLALARNESISFEQAAGLITDAAAVLGLSFAETSRITDVFTKGANISTTSAVELGEALKYAGAQGKAAGLDLEKTTALLDALAQAGIRGEQSGTALRNIFSLLSDPASKAREALAALGDSSGNLESALKTLSAAGPRAEQAILSFGVEAGPALRALIATGTAGIAEYERQLRLARGETEKTAAALSNDLTFSFSGLVASVTEAAERLGAPLLGPLKTEIDGISERIRTAADDGTLSAFGERIRAAFVAAQKWVREFVGSFDFDGALARVRTFADSSIELLGTFSVGAKSISNGVNVAFNSIMAGASVVGAGITGLLGLIVSGFAAVELALARVGLGSAEAAKELEIKAAGLRASYQALADEAAASALRVRQAWDDTSSAASSSAAAQVAAQQQITQAQQDAAAAITLTADQLDAYTRASEASAAAAVAAAAITKQAEFEKQKALTESAQAVADLRREAEALAQAGDLTGAAEKWKAFGAAVKRAASDGAASASAVSAAFGQLGLTPQAGLDALAKQARTAFETIRDSGTAAADDVRRAFLAYAKDALAAVAEGTEAQKAEVRAQLESQAALLGMRDALRELSGARDTDTAAKKRNAQATDEGTEKQAQANEALREGASASQGMAQALAAARAGLYGLSQAAGIAYDKLIASRPGEMWPAQVAEQIRGAEAAAAGGAEQLRYLAQQAREAAAAANYFGRARAGFALDAFADQAIIVERVKARFYDAAAAVSEMQQRLEAATQAGTVGMRDIEAGAAAARAGADLLDAQQLDGLNGALDAARQKLTALKDAATDTLTALRNELDELNGNAVAIENRRAAAQRLALQQQLDAARASGDAAALNALRESERLAAEIHAKRLEQIRRETADKAKADAENAQRARSATDSSTTGTAANAAQVRTLPVRTVRLEIPGVGTLEATEASANRVLTQIERARSTSL